MKIIDYQPSKVLQPFVKCFKIIESDHDIVNRVLPETAPVMVFRFRGQVNYLTDGMPEKLPNLVLTGLKKSARLINYNRKSANILVIFREVGIASFFGIPVHELFEKSVSLENFITRSDASDIEEQLALAKDNMSRITLVENFLLSKYQGHAPDRFILSAVRKIHETKGLCRISDLASSMYISQDALEKRFRKQVGASPKQFSSIVRMKKIVAVREKAKSFTEVAMEAGFFDQPHFNKEFRHFTGLTPSDFFKSMNFYKFW